MWRVRTVSRSVIVDCVFGVPSVGVFECGQVPRRWAAVGGRRSAACRRCKHSALGGQWRRVERRGKLCETRSGTKPGSRGRRQVSEQLATLEGRLACRQREMWMRWNPPQLAGDMDVCTSSTRLSRHYPRSIPAKWIHALSLTRLIALCRARFRVWRGPLGLVP